MHIDLQTSYYMHVILGCYLHSQCSALRAVIKAWLLESEAWLFL